jgi:hypothetical protein
MNTDSLIRTLAADARPVRRDAAGRALRRTLPPAFLASVAIAVGGYGLRPDLLAALTDPMLWVKLAFPALLAACAAAMLRPLATPGDRVGGLGAAPVLPVLALAALAAQAWSAAPVPDRDALLWGETWRSCSASIVLVSLPVLAVSIRALRRAAPTSPIAAGAAAGLLAGGLGTFAYALHCPEMAAPFLLAWNGLGIAATTALGAAAGHRWLRW